MLDRKSYTGFVYILAGCVFTWESKKQRCVALSNIEAEYVALATAAKDAMYLRTLTSEIGLLVSKNPTLINSDNLSAQQISKNPTHHAASKHIDIKYHFIRKLLNDKIIVLNYVNTNDMVAEHNTYIF